MGASGMIVAGLDIGGTKCAALLADVCEKEIKFLEREQIETKGAWQSILNALCDRIERFASRHGVVVEAAGISCGGPLSSSRGVILSPPNLLGWDEVPACAYVAERLGLAVEAVRLKNDADACAVAEWKYGAGRGVKNMVFLTFGTGLGAGLILNGRLYSGTNDMAGEVGHIRLEKFGPVGYGKAGAFEGFCSGGGIAQLADLYFMQKAQRGEPCPYYGGAGSVSAKVLGEHAAAGDADALAIFDLVGEYFGKGVSVLVDILNPEVIVAGSIYTRCKEFIEPAMRREMEKECLAASYAQVRVLPSELGEKIGDYGAVVAALN